MSRFSFELYEDPIVSSTETQDVQTTQETQEITFEVAEEPANSPLFEAPEVSRPLVTAPVTQSFPNQLEEKLAQFAPIISKPVIQPSLIPTRSVQPVQIAQSPAPISLTSRLPLKPQPQDAFELVSALHFEEDTLIQTPAQQLLAEEPEMNRPLSTMEILETLDAAPAVSSKSSKIHLRTPWKSLAFYATLFLLPIGIAGGINLMSSAPGFGGAPSATASELVAALPPGENITPARSPSSQGGDVQRATLASANTTDKSVEYELSLSASFLRKAVQMSNSTSNQTTTDKNRIIGLLNQSLEAANRAIQASPNDPRAYTTRGRVYQATSVVKPEMKAMADADFAKAKELGSSSPTDVAPTTNPLELLPTEQAKAKETAMIAAPTTSIKQTVTAETTNNANKGSAVMPVGQKEVFVAFPTLKDSTQVYVKPEGDAVGTYFVKNKQAGKGFTVATTDAPTVATTLSWWEIL